MSSTTITVKPKRRSARSPPPPPPKSSNNSGPRETVLLRNPLPKYSFQTRDNKSKATDSLPTQKQNSSSDLKNYAKSESSKKVEFKDHAHSGQLSNNSEKQRDCNASGANMLVGEFHPSFQQKSDLAHVKADPSTGSVYDPASLSSSGNINRSSSEPLLKEKPINVVDPVQNHDKTGPESASVPQTVKQDSVTVTLPTTNDQTSSAVTSHSVLAVFDEGATPAVAATGSVERSCDCSEQINAMQKENQYLKTQLNVQLQVNTELKKLLIASIGEDLHQRVELLTRDKAELCLEVGGYTRKVTEDYEHLDKVSIQADMWRSKYLASRVMADELASSKAFFSMQFEECQNALHQLLNERHELKAHLAETYRTLQQVRGAFDPLNSDSSSMMLKASKDNLDLARANQQLGDAIKYRLLPSHVTTSMSNAGEPDWHDYLTRAEAHATELLSREVRPEDFRNLPKPAIVAPGHMALDRYNPYTRFDKLTINVCCKCKGDVTVV